MFIQVKSFIQGLSVKARDTSNENTFNKKNVKLQFRNFWKGFDYRDHFGFLLKEYDIRITNNPDCIIYSCYGSPWYEKYMPHIESKAVRVFYTGENVRPDMNKCDYAISFCYEDDIKSPRHFRIPNYTFRLWKFGYNSQVLMKNNINIQKVLLSKNKFCNFIYSNPSGETRNQFFHKLSEYKPVDAAGKLFNNIGKPIPGGHGSGHKEKIDFMRPYKFTIAFENSSYPGYTTEKIVEAMLANTVPIYWGNPEVHRDFNPKSFISFYDCGCSLDKLRKRVEEVDQNDELYLSYLQDTFLHENKISKYLDENYVLDVFRQILG